MDQQPHPLLLAPPRPNETDIHECLSSSRRKCVSHKGKDLAVRRMLVCFPAESLTRLAVWGRSLSCKRMISSDSIPGRFDFIERSSTLNHQEMNHTSLLLFAFLHFQCWTNTLYTTLTFRAIKKQLCGPVRFHYACLLPYRWQYPYVTSLASFCDECVLWGVFGFHLTAPGTKSRIHNIKIIKL